MISDPELLSDAAEVYANAVTCVELKPKEMKKTFLQLPADVHIEILENKDTPHGLWIARCVCARARAGSVSVSACTCAVCV